MTSDLWAWPALGDSPGASRGPWVVDCQHAIWGKAHGVRTDYRCLGETVGMEAEESGVIIDANLGGEEEPRRSQAWKPLTRIAGHAAIGFYESRAIDATGRRRFLEKHILTWNGGGRVPFVAAALGMLREVAALDDAAWWGTRDDPRWHEPNHRLALDRRSLPIKPGELDAEVAQALAELTDYVAADALTLRRLLRALLVGVPAVLAGRSGPPPFRVLAALLLPFPAEEARCLQLAGWMPTTRWPELAAWDVVFCEATALEPAPVIADAIVEARAARMAEALLSRTPQLLAGDRGAGVVGIGLRRGALSLARARGLELPEGRTDAWGAILGQTLPFDDWARGLSVLRALPGALERMRERVAAAARQGDRASIARLIEGAVTDVDRVDWLADWLAAGGVFDSVPPVLRASIEPLLDFAASSEQHWLSGGALEHMHLRSFADDQDPRARLLVACVARVEGEIGAAPTPRSWGAKAALLRSAVIALAPGSPEARRWAETWPGPAEVSPLVVSAFLEDGSGALERLGRRAIERAVEESTRSVRLRDRERLRKVEGVLAGLLPVGDDRVGGAFVVGAGRPGSRGP